MSLIIMVETDYAIYKYNTYVLHAHEIRALRPLEL